MFETQLRLQHDMPFSNLSKAIPENEIQRWCNLKFDILEIRKTRSGSNLKQKVLDTLKQIGTEVAHIKEYTDSVEAVVNCKCSVNNSTIAIIESSNSIPVMPVIYRQGYEYVRFISYSGKEFKDTISKLESFSSVEVTYKKKVTRRLGSAMAISISNLLGSLTKKQLDSLVLALEMGYYSIPRKTTVEKIANALGIPRSTYEEHLRKAEVKILQSMRPYLRLAQIE